MTIVITRERSLCGLKRKKGAWQRDREKGKMCAWVRERINV